MGWKNITKNKPPEVFTCVSFPDNICIGVSVNLLKQEGKLTTDQGDTDQQTDTSSDTNTQQGISDEADDEEKEKHCEKHFTKSD